MSPSVNETIIDTYNLYRFKDLKIIVDISCDINSTNNPIKLHYPLTNFSNPVFQINDNIDIILFLAFNILMFIYFLFNTY